MILVFFLALQRANSTPGPQTSRPVPWPPLVQRSCLCGADSADSLWEQQLAKGWPRLPASHIQNTHLFTARALGRLSLWASAAVPVTLIRFIKKHQMTQTDLASLSNQVNHKYLHGHHNSAEVRKCRKWNEIREKVHCKLLAVYNSCRTSAWNR